jgi:hypothetical protein
MLFVFPSRRSNKTSLVKNNNYQYVDFLDKSFAMICKDKSLSYQYLKESGEKSYLPITIMNVTKNNSSTHTEIIDAIFNKNKYAIFKPNKGSQGAGIEVVRNKEEMELFFNKNPTTDYTVSEFLFSTYTNWKNNPTKTLNGTIINQTINGHKANIRPYIIIQIINENNKYDPVSKTVIKVHNPPLKDNIKIKAYLHPNLVFMAAKDDYITKDIIDDPRFDFKTHVGSLITNLTATKGLSKDSVEGQINEALKNKYGEDIVKKINNLRRKISNNENTVANYNEFINILDENKLDEYFSTYYNIEQVNKLKLYTMITPETSKNGKAPVDEELYNNIIKQIKVIASDFLRSVKDNLFCGNYNSDTFLGCHKLFVFDTHLDENKNLWFIEANTEPGLDAIHLAYEPNDINFTGVQTLFNDIMCSTTDLTYLNNENCGKLNLIDLDIDVKQTLDKPADLKKIEYKQKYLKYKAKYMALRKNI